MPNLQQIQKMARSNGLSNINKMKKAELIRAVQVAEGNSPCFQRISACGQMDCLFRGDCLIQEMRV